MDCKIPPVTQSISRDKHCPIRGIKMPLRTLLRQCCLSLDNVRHSLTSEHQLSKTYSLEHQVCNTTWGWAQGLSPYLATSSDVQPHTQNTGHNVFRWETTFLQRCSCGLCGTHRRPEASRNFCNVRNLRSSVKSCQDCCVLSKKPSLILIHYTHTKQQSFFQPAFLSLSPDLLSRERVLCWGKGTNPLANCPDLPPGLVECNWKRLRTTVGLRDWRAATMAVSNTSLRFFCVSAEHSTYARAPRRCAVCRAACSGTGCSP